MGIPFTMVFMASSEGTHTALSNLGDLLHHRFGSADGHRTWDLGCEILVKFSPHIIAVFNER